jgi:hypothetical protein
MNSSVHVPKKKLYRSPVLKTYGSLTDMTAATSNMGSIDNAKTGTNHKTG